MCFAYDIIVKDIIDSYSYYSLLQICATIVSYPFKYVPTGDAFDSSTLPLNHNSHFSLTDRSHCRHYCWLHSPSSSTFKFNHHRLTTGDTTTTRSWQLPSLWANPVAVITAQASLVSKPPPLLSPSTFYVNFTFVRLTRAT